MSTTTIVSAGEAYRVFRNVCIETVQPNDAESHVFYVLAFDQSQPAEDTTFQVEPNDKKRYNYQWIVKNEHSKPPATLDFAAEVAVFSGYWWDWGNIYKILFFLTPMAYEAIEFANERLDVSARQLPKTHVIPKQIHNNKHWFDISRALGYHRVTHADLHSAGGGEPVQQCFKYALIQSAFTRSRESLGINGVRRTTAALQRVNDYLEVTTKHQCTSKYALFIQRNRTRHILNINDLMKVATSKGYSDVRMLYFENKTFAEQWALVRCAELYVGAQGAGLTWFMFLSPGTTFVELVFDGWHPFYRDCSSTFRHDVTTLGFTCDRITPDVVWRKYAKLWFNYDGPISKTWIQKLNKRAGEVKRQVRYSNTPWKDSDLRCPTNGFLEKPASLVWLFGMLG